MAVPTTPTAPAGLTSRRKTRVYDIFDSGLATFFTDLVTYITSPYVTMDNVGAIQATLNPVPPTGWLICDGSTFVATDYPDLFTLLGTNVLPDYRDHYLVGANAIALGGVGGANSVTLTTNEMPAHTHTITDPGHSHTAAAVAGTGDGTGASGVDAQAGTTSTDTTGITVDSSGNGQPFDNRPLSVGINWIIFGGSA